MRRESLKRITSRHRLLIALLGGATLVLLGAIAGIVVLLSGAYSTNATEQHLRITYRLLETGLRYSVDAAVEGIEAPSLEDPRLVQLGAACYRAHCEACHGGPGVARDALGKGMLPSPTALAQSGREWSAASLYYIVKKGVRMTGMPAWEYRIAEDGLWATTAYLRAAPFLAPAAHRRLRESAAGLACPVPVIRQVPYSAALARLLFRQYACHSCHRIDGVIGPDTHVGPPLEHWADRGYIAGVLPNTQENFVRWVLDPPAISGQTMMPALGVPDAHARVMYRYLVERPR